MLFDDIDVACPSKSLLQSSAYRKSDYLATIPALPVLKRPGTPLSLPQLLPRPYHTTITRIVGRTGRWPGQGNGHEDGQNRTVDIRVNRTWDRIGDRTVCRAEQCAEHDDGQSRTMVRVGR